MKIQTGLLHIDLLQLLWFPLLITDSKQLVKEIALLFMDAFLFGYPYLPKDKLKQLVQAYTKMNRANNEFTDDSVLNFALENSELTDFDFEKLIIPFYLP